MMNNSILALIEQTQAAEVVTSYGAAPNTRVAPVVVAVYNYLIK